MKKEDIVLIPFPFTDLSGVKNRPALILAEAKSDITVAFITTQMIEWPDNASLLPASQVPNRDRDENNRTIVGHLTKLILNAKENGMN